MYLITTIVGNNPTGPLVGDIVEDKNGNFHAVTDRRWKSLGETTWSLDIYGDDGEPDAR